MKNLIMMMSFVLISAMGFSQISDTTNAQTQTKYQKQTKPAEPIKYNNSKASFKKLYFGGSMGFSFGNYTSVRIYPLIGYKVTPKLSAGFKFMYEYAKSNYYSESKTYNNYGASIFSRYRIIPQIYLHAEYSYMNYQSYKFNGESYRYGVPYLLLGGGFVQRIGASSFAYAEILFDVLNDSNSPYAEWAPFYSVGVSVGF